MKNSMFHPHLLKNIYTRNQHHVNQNLHVHVHGIYIVSNLQIWFTHVNDIKICKFNNF